MAWVPEPDKDGVRRYGHGIGVRKEDATRCVVSVHERGRSMLTYQCLRKRGFGVDGLYCKQHDPAEQAKRDHWRQERYEEKMERSPGREIARLRARIAELETALDAQRADRKEPQP